MRNDDPQFMLFRGRGVSQQILNRAPCELDFLGFLVVRVLFLGTLVRWGQNPGVFHSHGATPIVGWFVRENPHLKYGWWLGVTPMTLDTSKYHTWYKRSASRIQKFDPYRVKLLPRYKGFKVKVALEFLCSSVLYNVVVCYCIGSTILYIYIYIHNHIYI